MVEVIVVRGPLGIGKTTISKLVAKKLDALYYSVDSLLKENKLDVINWDIGCIPEEHFIKINDLLVPLIIKNLDNDQSVVVDGNFYHKKQLDDLLNRLTGYSSHVFTLIANVETCIKRDSLRKNPHGLEAAKSVHKLVSKFNFGISILNEDSDVDEKVSLIISKL